MEGGGEGESEGVRPRTVAYVAAIVRGRMKRGNEREGEV